MLKISILIAGIILTVINWYCQPFSALLQTVVFIIGFTIVGIPHGGADQLVAITSSKHHHVIFSAKNFSRLYCGKIFLFCFFFYCLPHFTLLIFLLMSAYHFGETDLLDLDRDTFLDRFLRLNYGILILETILLPNFSSVRLTSQSKSKRRRYIHYKLDQS